MLWYCYCYSGSVHFPLGEAFHSNLMVLIALGTVCGKRSPNWPPAEAFRASSAGWSAFFFSQESVRKYKKKIKHIQTTFLFNHIFGFWLTKNLPSDSLSQSHLSNSIAWAPVPASQHGKSWKYCKQPLHCFKCQVEASCKCPHPRRCSGSSGSSRSQPISFVSFAHLHLWR